MKITEYNSLLLTGQHKTKPCDPDHCQTLLEFWQAWCCDHFPGEPVPVPDHHPSEEPFPNVQSELP